jgi:type I restriction enzyme S subunit
MAWNPKPAIGGETVSSGELRSVGRLDTGLYSRRYRSVRDAATDASGKWTRLTDLGLETRRGQNLQVSAIGASQEANVPTPGWYRVIKPTDIATEGILTEEKYLGSPRELKTVDAGSIVFGGEATWRSMVICEDIVKCTTNIHATILEWPGHDLYEAIWLRCWLEFLREHGVLKEIAAGGLGGSLGIRMYKHVPVPRMDRATKVAVAKLYFNDRCGPFGMEDVERPAQVRAWTRSAGIWQLDREAKALRLKLSEVQDRILRGQPAGV